MPVITGEIICELTRIQPEQNDFTVITINTNNFIHEFFENNSCYIKIVVSFFFFRFTHNLKSPWKADWVIQNQRKLKKNKF